MQKRTFMDTEERADHEAAVPKIQKYPLTSFKGSGDTSTKRLKLSSESQEGKSNLERQYFTSYEDLGVHLEMIRDVSRTNTYRLAILKSFDKIAGKVVADIGAGTGILSCFCVQAGARKVYAIEASSIAEKAKEVIIQNKMDDKIEIIKGRVEEINLPEKVDVIVSEWMGYSLLYESMLNSVICARDKWLKAGGWMLPSSAHIFIAPFTDDSVQQERVDYWKKTADLYGVDMSCLVPHAKKSLTNHIQIELIEDCDLIARACKCIDLDLNTVQEKDLKQIQGRFHFDCFGSDKLSGFVTWFTTAFNSVDPDKEPVLLSTAPSSQPTHWRQSLMYLEDSIDVQQGTTLEGSVTLSPNPSNARFLDVNLRFTIDGKDEKSNVYQLNDGLP
ncbi:Protein arginine N-methyltransferase 6 [Holothuria leucospilota]|uniref:Protein arginine N-methyltransferase 2 n=1 Tax=Holothuria leucospilota TaxID=206669 RepID=A0A9Q1CLV5_HOLLE|nr:Protein arginine N-methyltransferase 6 [Holothuria leucospilota]